MLRKSMLFAAVLTLSSLAVAQHKTQKEALAEGLKPTGDATTTCSVTYNSGSGVNQTSFCVTVNGNIVQFSVSGEEMINVGIVGEGYGICDLYSGSSYYDYAYADSGNWGSPSFTHSGNTVTVTRLTNDGIWSLKQTITNVPANAAGPGSAKVTMALKNLSGVTRDAYLVRYADVDANGNTDNNDFDYTYETAYGLAPGFYRGLSTVNGTFTVDQVAFAQSVYSGPDPCDPLGNQAAQPFYGDGSIGQVYLLEVPHNATKTLVSTYKPI